MRKAKRARRKVKTSFIATVLVVLVFLVSILVFALQKPEITLADSLRFPVGAKVCQGDLVKKIEGGSLVDPDKAVDSSKAGTVKCILTLENLLKVESEKEVLVEFYQSESKKKTPTKEENKPQEENKTEEAVENKTEEPAGNKNDASTSPEKNPEGGTTGSQGMGAQGSTNNSQGNSGTTAVIEAPFGAKGALIDGSYKTKNGKTIVIKNGLATIDGILIANKSYSLPKTYTSPYLQPEAESAYYKMRDAAKTEGFTLSIQSAYRSWNDQNYIFNGYVSRDGLDKALTYSARPGHSEHQTGLGVDLVTSSTAESKTPAIKPTLDWLAKNAYKYGYILRYPEGKTDITGYIYEPWHYRYVGVELATELYNDGDWITLEEYFGIDSVYRGY